MVKLLAALVLAVLVTCAGVIVVVPDICTVLPWFPT